MQVESEVTAEQFYPSGDTAYFRVTGQGEREIISFHRLSSASALNLNIIAWELAQFVQDPKESIRLVGQVADPILHLLKIVDQDRNPLEEYCAVQMKLAGRTEPSRGYRWHMDGPYFTAATGPLKPRYKYGCVLVGQPTVFLRTCPVEVLRQVAACQLSNRSEVKIDGSYDPITWSRIVSRNSELHRLVGDQPMVWAAHHGVALKWRADFTGDVYSEPVDGSGRMFVGVICGTKEEIEEYREKVYGQPAQAAQVRFN
jgi:hypothetical protein